MYIGIQAVGKATVEAWKQVRTSEWKPPVSHLVVRTNSPLISVWLVDVQPREGSIAGGQAAAGDPVTKAHKMTLDEACDILNINKSRLSEHEEVTRMLRVRPTPWPSTPRICLT
jgi:hypothetical protein